MIKDLGKGRYRFIVSVGGRDSRQRFCKTIEHKGGKRELQRLYNEFEAECRKDPLSDITVRDLLESYVSHCKTLGRKSETIRGYEITAERIYPLLGKILAKNLTTYRLEKFVAEMVDKSLSAKTIKNTIGLLSAAYRHSILIGQLETNPCEHLILPKGEARDIRILYMDEIQPFLDGIADVDINEKCAYELALFMGLRRSEILGLKEDDVDILKGMLFVHSTRHRTYGVDIEQDTKTKRSTRVLALPDILLIDLARLLETHRQFKYPSVDYLIQDGFGNAMNPSSLASRLTRLEEKHKLPHVTLHGLRHTYASLLNASGVDMAMISAELGHSNLTTTMNVYTHRFRDASQASRGIAQTINSFTQIGGKSVANEEIKKP